MSFVSLLFRTFVDLRRELGLLFVSLHVWGGTSEGLWGDVYYKVPAREE